MVGCRGVVLARRLKGKSKGTGGEGDETERDLPVGATWTEADARLIVHLSTRDFRGSAAFEFALAAMGMALRRSWRRWVELPSLSHPDALSGRLRAYVETNMYDSEEMRVKRQLKGAEQSPNAGGCVPKLSSWRTQSRPRGAGDFRARHIEGLPAFWTNQFAASCTTAPTLSHRDLRRSWFGLGLTRKSRFFACGVSEQDVPAFDPVRIVPAVPAAPLSRKDGPRSGSAGGQADEWLHRLIDNNTDQ